MAIALVTGQKAVADSDLTSGASIAVAFPSGVTAGNLIVVQSGNADTTNTQTPDSVVDNAGGGAGNTYSINQVSQWSTTPDQRVDGHYAKNIANGGSCTVTVNWSPSVGWRHIHISEYSGVDTTAPLDKTASGTGNGTTYTTSSQTPTTDGELIYGGEGNGAGTINPGAGFTALSAGATYGNRSEYQIQGSAASIAASFTGSASDYLTIMMTFKAVSSATPRLPLLGVS